MGAGLVRFAALDRTLPRLVAADPGANRPCDWLNVVAS